MKLINILIAILVFLLFFGGPDYESSRLFQYIWDTGHLFLFSLVVFTILTSRYISDKSQVKILLAVIFSSLTIGFIIELLQIFYNRDYSLHDVINDVLGALIGYVLYRLKQENIPLLKQKRNIGFLAVLLLSGFYPLMTVILDEYMMRKEFPALANFESSYQLSRWDVKSAEISLSQKHVREGKHSLKVIFFPDRYPDITLQHFAQDWRGFSKLGFSLFNPVENGPVSIELKIYDKKHVDNGYKYSDRFNHELLLQPGWNDIVLSLDTILKSPETRVMNKEQLKSVSLFLHDISHPLMLFVDEVKLY